MGITLIPSFGRAFLAISYQTSRESLPKAILPAIGLLLPPLPPMRTFQEEHGAVPLPTDCTLVMLLS